MRLSDTVSLKNKNAKYITDQQQQQQRPGPSGVSYQTNPISPHPDYITLAHNNHVSLFTFMFSCITSVSEARPINKRYHSYPYIIRLIISECPRGHQLKFLLSKDGHKY